MSKEFKSLRIFLWRISFLNAWSWEYWKRFISFVVLYIKVYTRLSFCFLIGCFLIRSLTLFMFIGGLLDAVLNFIETKLFIQCPIRLIYPLILLSTYIYIHYKDKFSSSISLLLYSG